MMRLALIGVIGLAVFFVANVLLMPVAGFIPPSRMYFNERFSAQFAKYLERGPIDYLAIGNSRLRDAFDPDVFADTVSRSLGRAVSAHNLAAAGGYFPFYEQVLTGLIADKLPANLILGISPREFNKMEERTFKTRDALFRSPGYRLATLPYKQPARYLEQLTTDLAAAILPALFYLQNARALLIPQSLLDYARPTPERPPSPLRAYLWNQIKFAGASTQLPATWSQALTNISAFPRRLKAVYSWSPSDVASVNEVGFYPPRSETPEELAQRMSRQKAKWARLVETGQVDKFRHSDYCQTRMRIDRNPNASYHRIFHFLAEHSVRVHLVMLPAVWLEGCENNIEYGKNLVEYINQTILTKYDNILSFIVMNDVFSSPNKDMLYYKELEHIFPGKSGDITRTLATPIARASN